MRLLAGLSRVAAGRRSRWIVIGAWLAAALATLPLQSPLSEEAADESDTFLVRGSESAEAERLIERSFNRGSEAQATIVYHRRGGLTTDDGQRMDADALEICRAGDIASLSRVGTPYLLACGEEDPLDMGVGESLLLSSDGSVGLVSVLMTDDSTPAAEQAAAAIRAVVPPPGGDETGLSAYVTGEVGFEADRSEAVKGIDETLLAVTVTVLLLLLLATYRSPLVAAVPLAVTAVAYLVAGGITYGLVAAGATDVSGQTTAILIVLMFGAGTDYCLLIVARFRDELRRVEDAGEAMARASERTGRAIASAGAIVVAAMLVLALADWNAMREMGPILALGVAIMVAAGLTLLPALLAALGRRAFWPAIPRPSGSEPEPAPIWRRAGALVARRPTATALTVAAVLAAGALANVSGRETLDFSEQFRDPPDSVLGQEVVGDNFVPGRAAPLQVVTPFDAGGDVTAALTGAGDRPVAEMYASARSIPPPGAAAPGSTLGPDGSIASELLLSDAYLAVDPFSDEATDAIPELRAAARDASAGEPVLIGGAVAEAHDTREALARDTRLIVPVSLGLILLILIAMLRAVVMPIYVIATVLLSFGFALGVSSLVFTHVLGEPASDPALPLFCFIFLVALGVDYNVFLLARIREERERGLPTPEAATRALERTGGVITSAGLVLAATFATLMALPLTSLFQIGFVVALGLLADTFLVRALLVPAIAVRLGEWSWWPRRDRGGTSAS